MTKTTPAFACFVAVYALLLACEKKETSDPPAKASASAVASASAAPEPEKPWFVGDWQASFEVERYQMEMKKSEGMVKDWETDEGKQGIGKATLEVSIGANELAQGKLTGALGEMMVSGRLEEETLRLKLMAQNAGDPANTFNGVVVAKKKGDTFTGDLKASSGDSLKVRKGSVVLAKGGSEEGGPEKGQ